MVPPVTAPAPAVATVDIACRDVSMVFVTSGGPVPALTNVTLDVQRGEFVALIGPSGCGKSTLLRLIADVLAPTGGTVEGPGAAPVGARGLRGARGGLQHPRTLPCAPTLVPRP